MTSHSLTGDDLPPAGSLKKITVRVVDEIID